MTYGLGRRWRHGVSAAAATAALGALLLAAPAQAQDTSEVYVVHGIPDQPVDVYVDDELTLEAFEPAMVSDPLSLESGSHTVDLTEPGGSVSDALVSSDVDITGGENVSLVAHLSEAGEPTLTPFMNDVEEVPSGQGRLTVRHVAAAEAVDVRVDGEPAVTDLTNPNEATTELPAGTVSAEVVLAGTEEAVIGPADLTLTDGALTVAYAIGSADEDTLELLVQEIQPSGTSSPSPSPTG